MAGGVHRERPAAALEAATEAKLAARLAKVTERLQADAPDMERPGADLIAWYLTRPAPGRPAVVPQARRYPAAAVRAVRRPGHRGISCQDIKAADMQRIVNAAPTEGEGARLRRCLSAMVTAGIAAGYLANPRLKEVHWQAAGRAAPAAGHRRRGIRPVRRPGRDPRRADVARLGRALAAGRRGELYELMATTAAYTGLRLAVVRWIKAGQR